jgi:hypothetical protein
VDICSGKKIDPSYPTSLVMVANIIKALENITHNKVTIKTYA